MSKEKNRFRVSSVFLATALYLGACLGRWFIGYSKIDSDRMGLIQNIVDYFPNYFLLPSFQKSILLLTNYHFPELVMLPLVCVYYIAQKKWLTFTWVLVGFPAYFILIVAAFPHSGDLFYLENLFIPIWVFLIFPLAFDIIPRLSVRHIIPLFSVMLIIKIALILQISGLYQTRHAWYKNVVSVAKEKEISKVIIPESMVPKDTLIMTWASPFEFWLTGLQNYPNDPPAITISYKPEKFKSHMQNPKVFISVAGICPYKSLPPCYFPYDTTSTYRVADDIFWK